MSTRFQPADFQLLFDASPHPCLILQPDPGFTIAAVNQRYLAETGTARGALLGRGLFEAFPRPPDGSDGEGTAALRASLAQVTREHRQHVMGVQRYAIPRADGSGEVDLKYWRLVNTPVLGPDGTLLYVTHHVDDVTGLILSRERADQHHSEERVKVEARAERSETEVLRRLAELRAANQTLHGALEELERRKAELASLNEQLQAQERRKDASLAEALHRLNAHIDNSPLAIIEFDAAFRVTRWSETAEHVFGWRADEIVGRSIGEIHWVFDDDRESVARLSADMLEGRSPRNQASNRNYHKDGSLIQCEWYNSAIYDDQGRLVSILSQVLDVTERRKTEQALLDSRQRLTQALGAGGSAAWELDVATETLTPVDEMLYAMVGHTPADLPRVADWMAHIHDDDRPAIMNKLGELIEGRCDSFRQEFRFRTKDGPWHWLLSQGVAAERNQEGRATRLIGINSDIDARKATEQRLTESEEKYRTLFANMTEGFVLGEPILDGEGKLVDVRYLEVNQAFYRHTGMPGDIAGRALREHLPQIEQEWIERYGAVAMSGREDHFQRYNIDTDRYYDVHVFSPRAGRFAILFRDITQRRQTEEALRESESRLALALRAGGTAVWEMDVATGAVMAASELLFTALGYRPGDLKTLSDWHALVHEEDQAEMAKMVGEVIDGRRDLYSCEVRVCARSGDWRWILSQATAAERDAAGRAVRLVGTHTDINERKLAEQRIREAALHDTLTGLPNRALVFEYGSHLLAAAARQHGRGALLFIDLDRFKPINDLYGHEIGDRVLQEVATRLSACTRHEDLVGRLGGDEFVIFLPFLDEPRQRAAVVAQHVVDAISAPFQIDSLELSLSPSVGISHYPADASEVGALIHAADLAMYQVKQSGRASYRFYTPELDQRADEANSLEVRLKHALRHDGLALHYQPVLDIASGRLVGAEALVRLAHADDEACGPARFIPIAESTGLIGDLGEWVINEACRQQAAWRGEGLNLCLAINVSPLQFRERNFSDRLSAIFSKADVDPRSFQLEITESTIMESLDEAVAILKRIKALGVTVALDDFGTGYSSLASLSSLPLDKLKVDQSFVRRIESDPVSRVVTDAIIALGRSLRLEVIGEGIETAAALRYLQEQGCAQAQGFWFSKPLPAAQFAEWCRHRPIH